MKTDYKTRNEIANEILESDIFLKLTNADKQRLQKAVNNFNSKRKRLIEKEKNLEKNDRYITNSIDKVSYKELKESILTRDELRHTLQSLRGFTKRGAEDVSNKILNETGYKISKWQAREMKSNIKTIKIRLTSELEEYKKEVKNAGGLSLYDMKNSEAIAIEDRIKNLENYKKKDNRYDFYNELRRLDRQGSYDIEYKKALNYMTNYIDTMQKYEGEPYYKAFMNKLKSFKNPIDFYNFIKEHGNDLQIDLHYQSDEYLKRAELEELFKSWGVTFKKDHKEIQEEEMPF